MSQSLWIRVLKRHAVVVSRQLLRSNHIARNPFVLYKFLQIFPSVDHHRCEPKRTLSSTSKSSLTSLEFESVCEETLESLAEYLEELTESIGILKNGDIVYSDGVITANLGGDFGTYVINRQTPNQQIWLSSPTSGPKRYDFVDGSWLYKHDNTTLHSILDKEISEIVKSPVNFSSCSFSGNK